MIERIPEPELMDDQVQARAYSEADFAAPHDFFVDQFKQFHGDFDQNSPVLDLGCGPADVTVRFAQAFTSTHIDAVDGAQAMLDFGEQRIKQAELTDRIKLHHLLLPATQGLAPPYQTIISNSLLHHLHDPMVLWNSVKQLGCAGTRVFIMDLCRPESVEAAHALRDQYASDEPEILQHDFFHSLLAAFRPDEVHAQLKAIGLGALSVLTPTDRHLIIHGIIE